MNVDQTIKPAGLNGILKFYSEDIVNCQNTLDKGVTNATEAPEHSTMTYHPTSTVISQDNNTIMRFIHIAAL